MRIREAVGSGESKVVLQMTPMIDIVFQLLIFFMFTFRIVTIEGEFSIHMPKAEGAQATPTVEPTSILPDIQVRLTADDQGELATITVGEMPVDSIDALSRELEALTGGDPAMAADVEVQLWAPEHLRFEYVIAAMNAAYRAAIQKIKFNPPGDDDGEGVGGVMPEL